MFLNYGTDMPTRFQEQLRFRALYTQVLRRQVRLGASAYLRKRFAGIAIISINDGCHVDVDDVTVFQHMFL